jgi:nicotinamide-nucleotide amidase
MRAEVIALGLTSPDAASVPAAASGISEGLAELGIELGSITIVRARDREIEEAFKHALKRSHLVIITGGRATGQTPVTGSEREDLAKKILSRLLDRRLVLQSELLKKIEDAYRARSLETPVAFEKMALLPHGAKALEDRQGSPSGFYMEHAGRYILYLPGMVKDLKAALPGEITAYILARNKLRRWERHRVIRTYGLEESKVKEALKGLAGKEAGFDFYSSPEGVDARVHVIAEMEDKAWSLLEETCLKVTSTLGDHCYGMGSDGMEMVVARLLTEKKLTISTAESCTGGLVAKRLTDVPGSSAYMERGVVTYSNQSKEELLNVPARTIAEQGAVSKETAQAMAEGIRWSAKTDLGLSVTGIAGPTGGTAAKPIGLVYIGLATPTGVTVKGYNFPGGREAIRFASSQRALDMVRRYLLS